MSLIRLNNKNLPCSNCKELKALKVVKEKGCSFIEIALIISCKSYNEYCIEMNSRVVYSNIFERKSSLKTKEEYELLKEVLCGL